MEELVLDLYLVTGRYAFSDAAFLRIIEEACENGVTLVQLREKELSALAYYALALKVKAVTDRYQVPLVIDDRVDICLAVDAAGVHIGDEDLPVSVVRKMLGQEKIIGVSAKSVERAVEAEKAGADYLGVGAIFPTQTKVKTRPTSLQTLKEITQRVAIPVVAIGGITEERLAVFEETGIAGVAVVSEIMLAEAVGEKVRRLKQKLAELALR